MHQIIEEFLINKKTTPIDIPSNEEEFKILAPTLCKIYKENINAIYQIHYTHKLSQLELKYLPLLEKNNSLTKLIFDSIKYNKFVAPKEINHILDDILHIFKEHDRFYQDGCINLKDDLHILNGPTRDYRDDRLNLNEKIIKWEKYKHPFVSWINPGEDLLKKYLSSRPGSEDKMQFFKLSFRDNPVGIKTPEYEFHILMKKISFQDILILLSSLECYRITLNESI